MFGNGSHQRWPTTWQLIKDDHQRSPPPKLEFWFFSQIFWVLEFSDVWFNLTSHGFNLILRKIIHRVSHGNHLTYSVTIWLFTPWYFNFCGGHQFILCCHWYPCFLTSAMGFKPIGHHLICVFLHLHAIDSSDSLLKEHLANLLDYMAGKLHDE